MKQKWNIKTKMKHQRHQFIWNGWSMFQDICLLYCAWWIMNITSYCVILWFELEISSSLICTNRLYFTLFLVDRSLWVKNWHMDFSMSLCLGKDLHVCVNHQNVGDAFTRTSTPACSVAIIFSDLSIWCSIY